MLLVCIYGFDGEEIAQREEAQGKKERREKSEGENQEGRR